MITIKKNWELYKKHCLPDNAPEAISKVLEQSFYAGIVVMLETFSALATPMFSEEAACTIMQELHTEAQQYMEKKHNEYKQQLAKTEHTN